MSVSSGERPGQRITGEEFERALERAESLLTSYDRGQARLRALTIGAVPLAALTTAALILSAGLAVSDSSAAVRAGWLAAVAVAVSGIWLLTGVSARSARSLRSTTSRDERAMLETIDILRELLPDVAEEEHWSPARYQLTRTRVARFPIGRRSAR